MGWSFVDGGQLHPMLGGASVHASLIEGGKELSNYPISAVLKVERPKRPRPIAASIASGRNAAEDGAG